MAGRGRDGGGGREGGRETDLLPISGLSFMYYPTCLCAFLLSPTPSTPFLLRSRAARTCLTFCLPQYSVPVFATVFGRYRFAMHFPHLTAAHTACNYLDAALHLPQTVVMVAFFSPKFWTTDDGSLGCSNATYLTLFA